MEYNFLDYLNSKLVNVASILELDVDIYVAPEQTFAKMEEFTPNTIYVVVKYLSSSIQYDAETMPIQILVLSEQNSLDKAKMLMNKFANDYNWNVIQENGVYIKQQYNSPVVLNNYTEVAYGYRSVLYVTGTLYIMENIVDVTDVTIDNVTIKPISFSMAYSMSTNTQQTQQKYIATSVKTVSTLSISLTIPMIESNLITKVMNILNETTDYDGNNTFAISFKCGLSSALSKNMKLISATITSAPNQVPGLQLGFME